MPEDRKITFGKYKGEPIKKLILTHIGYVMWCLSNLNWFELTKEEQALFDAMAIAIIDSDAETAYPKEELKNHIKDTWLLITKETPFSITSSGNVYCSPKDVEEFGIDKYVQRRMQRPMRLADLADLNREMSRFGFSEYDHDYDEIFDDALYKDLFC